MRAWKWLASVMHGKPECANIFMIQVVWEALP